MQLGETMQLSKTMQSGKTIHLSIFGVETKQGLEDAHLVLFSIGRGTQIKILAL
tara:strand:- start:439 stop:600 length:162 start_codon:yes stop_codon:yes gene_type:complete